MRRFPPSQLLAAPLFAALAGALAACPSAKPADHPAAAPSVVLVNGPPETSAPASASIAPTAEPPDAGPLVLGGSCSVRAPVFSDDACAVDADCAPLAVCHADACVAAARAGAMKPGTMCTADCRAGTLDCGCNHCGCQARADGQKRCAMLAGRATSP
jgi:hypothetical protein